MQDEESETEDRYQGVLDDGQYVVLVSTPTDERKELAVQLLASRGVTSSTISTNSRSNC